MPTPPDTLSQDPRAVRLRLAFELFEAGVLMERLRLRRNHPELSDAEIEELLRRWLRREGEPGDACGTVVRWPRTAR